jgi:hypothetical protein
LLKVVAVNELSEAFQKIASGLGLILQVLGNWALQWSVLLLLMLASAMVWSQMDPADYTRLGLTIPNFWWQLGAIGLLTGLTLLCGWLQGILNWAPAEIDLGPPERQPIGHGADLGHQ